MQSIPLKGSYRGVKVGNVANETAAEIGSLKPAIYFKASQLKTVCILRSINNINAGRQEKQDSPQKAEL